MSAGIELAQVDALLRIWDERLERMADNLVTLEGEAIHRVLAGEAGARPALEGVSRDRVARALDALAELFEDRERLAEVIERARSVRASMSPLAFWERDDKARAIQRLLSGPSIERGEEIAALGERALLDDGRRAVWISPENLLAAMVQRFDEAQRTLLAVSRAWSGASELSRVEARVAALRVRAVEVGPSDGRDLAELRRIEADVAVLRAASARDPLGVEGEAREAITPRLSALAARVEATGDARRRAHAALDEARALRRQLDEDHARAVALIGRARREIAGPSADRLPPALDEGALDGLDAWLRKLEATAAAARWSPAEVGVARFLEAATCALEAEARAAAQAEALLARRDELVGRLSARRAQAASLSARGIDLPTGAEDEARRAEALLRRRPALVDEAARGIEVFEAMVVAVAARR